MNLRSRRRKFITVVFVLALIAGCAKAPDIKPFTDATAAMSAAMRSGYDGVEAMLVRASADDQPKSDEVKKELKRFGEVNKPTRDAITIIGGYADSLAAVVEAGDKGKESTEALFNSLNGLLSVVNTLQIPQNLVGVGAIIGRELAEARRLRDLKRAVRTADAAVQYSAEILALNYKDLERINTAVGNSLAANYENDNQVVLNYHRDLVASDVRSTRILTRILEFEGAPSRLREQAERRRNNLREGETQGQADTAAQDILNKLPEAQKENLNSIRSIDPGLPANLAATDPDIGKKLETRQGELLALSKARRAELERINPQYSVVAAELKAIDDTTQSNAKVLQKSQAAIKAWAKAHTNLRLALEKKQKRISLTELTTLVKELTDAYEKQGDK